MTDQEILDLISSLAEQEIRFAETAKQLRAVLSDRLALLDNGQSQQSREAMQLLEDFVRNAKTYRHYATTTGRRIFLFLASPSAFESMRSASAKGLPAVAGIAESLVQQSSREGLELTNTDRQFVGAVVRFRMAADGYQKTSKRGSIHCAPFTRGQVYSRIGN
ncbi:MAG TPA: hypothetical protein VE866_04760 [Candidatus Binatia bacterium]|nr:hypothetical protein [Candidatus Binatia bacterium]